jgi:hypothetical protein
MKRKFTPVTAVSVQKFEQVNSGFNTITINYRQRCTYELACGHTAREDSQVGSQPKKRIM